MCVLCPTVCVLCDNVCSPVAYCVCILLSCVLVYVSCVLLCVLLCRYQKEHPEAKHHTEQDENVVSEHSAVTLVLISDNRNVLHCHNC